jgi:hypothetical protein
LFDVVWHSSCDHEFVNNRKEVKQMKTARLLAVTLLAGGLLVARTASATDGVISKTELTPGSYCHMTFPAITDQSLFTDHPVLKSADSGDLIDFYGPCDENPVGADQVAAQRNQYFERQEHLPEGEWR